MKTDSRTVLWIAGALIALGLVIAGVLAATQEPELLDASTPEGVAQRYLQAVFDGDRTEADQFLSKELQERCDRNDRFEFFEQGGRAVLLDTDVRDGRTIVNVEVTETYGGSPFDTSEYSFDVRLVLENQGGRWVITEPPWPLSYCPEGSES